MGGHMDFFAQHSGLRRGIALILATILTSGCMTWRPVVGPQSYLTAERPSHVRASLAGGQIVELYNPTVVANDLVGFQQKGVDSTRISIPMQIVRVVEVWQKDDGATTTLTLVLAGVAGLVVFGAVAASTMCIGCGITSSLPRM